MNQPESNSCSQSYDVDISQRRSDVAVLARGGKSEVVSKQGTDQRSVRVDFYSDRGLALITRVEPKTYHVDVALETPQGNDVSANFFFCAKNISLSPMRYSGWSRTDVKEFRRELPQIEALLEEALLPLVTAFGEPKFSLRVFVNPDDDVQPVLIVKVNPGLPLDDAMDAMSRFRQTWWNAMMDRADNRLWFNLDV